VTHVYTHNISIHFSQSDNGGVPTLKHSAHSHFTIAIVGFACLRSDNLGQLILVNWSTRVDRKNPGYEVDVNSDLVIRKLEVVFLNL
jgi:hypothetical protein